MSLPFKARHERKTFATPTLKKINLRLHYYRKVLNDPSIDPNSQRYQRIKNKYDHCLKVRQLLNRAVKNLYT